MINSRDRSPDPRIQLEAGRALIRLGEVRRILGQIDGSDQAYRQAATLFEALSKPGLRSSALQLDLRLGRAETAIGRGLTDHARSRLDAARRDFAAAIAILRPLKSDAPKVPLYRERLAFCEASVGHLDHDAGDDTAAESAYRRGAGPL